MTDDDQSNQSATSPTNSEAVRSGDWLGTGAGQTLSRPTAAGWWWFRISGTCEQFSDWEPVKVTEHNGGLRAAAVEIWGFNKGNEWIGEWAGPLTPAPVPSDKLSEPAKGDVHNEG